MALGPSASGLEFFLDTGGLLATQVGLRLLFDISRLGRIAMLPLAEVSAVGRHHTIIMFGMLKISFGSYSIAGRRRFLCEG